MMFRKRSSGFRGAAQAEGTIVDFQAKIPGATWMRAGGFMAGGTSQGVELVRRPVYAPTVEFTTADGTTVRATPRIGTNPQQGRVGDTVTVFYDPRNPQKVRVE